MKIKILSDEVINQIAAGEVVDRPASIVRELVDNAVDSGADDILVSVVDGGQSCIRVADNGCGMSFEDAKLAFQRHATSKLSSASDLNKIATMGFRGEALPAIAAVAKVRLRSREASSQLGCQIVIEGGAFKSCEEVACAPGTEIEVSGVFFNTPARRKFLKSPRSEEQRIKEWLSNSALCRPQIRYRLLLGEREVLNLPKRASAQQRAESFIRGACVTLNWRVGPCSVSGVVAHPSLAEVGPQGLVVVVNQRVVVDKLIARAAKEGFSGTLKEREFPVGFVSLEIAPGEVDVNVHPQKGEVRFANPQAIFLAVRSAVSEAVKEFKSSVSDSRASFSSAPDFARRPMAGAVNWSPSVDGVAEGSPRFESGTLALQLGNRTLTARESEIEPDTQLRLFKFSELRYIGQLLECYLLCELDDCFYAIDMHAAHERINYNLILAALEKRAFTSQRLLLPTTVQLSERSFTALKERSQFWRELGFELALEDLSASIVAQPSFLSTEDSLALVKELAAISEDGDFSSASTALRQKLAARLACHASIRSGQKLSSAEVQALFEKLDTEEFSAACPHGRPVITSFARAEIERWFGRDR